MLGVTVGAGLVDRVLSLSLSVYFSLRCSVRFGSVVPWNRCGSFLFRASRFCVLQLPRMSPVPNTRPLPDCSSRGEEEGAWVGDADSGCIRITDMVGEQGGARLGLT